MKKTLATAMVSASLAISAGAAHALPIGLALVLDQSGSISPANWTLQKDAYANVLNSSLIPTDSSLVIGVWKFSNTVQEVFAPTLIADAASKSALVTAINGMSQSGGNTAIGTAVTTAADAFVSFGLGGLEKVVIDVSTDGVSNAGTNPTLASNNALAAGIDAVNCLAIGGGASCNWNPLSSLDFTAATFADFERTLRVKIATETNQVPEPVTLGLVGLGLAGIGMARGKSKK